MMAILMVDGVDERIYKQWVKMALSIIRNGKLYGWMLRFSSLIFDDKIFPLQFSVCMLAIRRFYFMKILIVIFLETLERRKKHTKFSAYFSVGKLRHGAMDILTVHAMLFPKRIYPDKIDFVSIWAAWIKKNPFQNIQFQQLDRLVFS